MAIAWSRCDCDHMSASAPAERVASETHCTALHWRRLPIPAILLTIEAGGCSYPPCHPLRWHLFLVGALLHAHKPDKEHGQSLTLWAGARGPLGLSASVLRGLVTLYCSSVGASLLLLAPSFLHQ